MRRSKTITKTEEVKVIEEIVCNACGKQAKHIDCTDIQPYQFDFGFGSMHDGENWDFDLCDTCVEKIIGNFKIPPNKEKMTW